MNLIQELRDSNPYKWGEHSEKVWETACNKLEELLKQQPAEWEPQFRNIFMGSMVSMEEVDSLIEWLDETNSPQQ